MYHMMKQEGGKYGDLLPSLDTNNNIESQKSWFIANRNDFEDISKDLIPKKFKNK